MTKSPIAHLDDEVVWTNRVWAAWMLAKNVHAWDAMLQGHAVPARYLDRRVYLRTGRRLPPGDKTIHITPEMLDRINAGGPFEVSHTGKLREPGGLRAV